MKKFEFESNVFNINLNGAEFSCDPASAEAAFTSARNEAAQFAEKISAGTVLPEDIESTCAALAEKIDSALGEGACRAVFGDRTVSFHDLTDIIMYAIAALNEFEKEKSELYGSYGVKGIKR